MSVHTLHIQSPFGSIAQPALSLTTGPPREFKPAWSPDSQFIYYAKDNPSPQFLDIVKRPSTGGAEIPVQAASGIDEYQPSISPDGTKMCFTLQTTPGNSNTSNIYVTDAQGNVVKVTTSDSSRFTHTGQGSIADVRPGDTVVVQGQKGADGIVAAAAVADAGATAAG